MTNTYDILLNPPPSKQPKIEEKKVDASLLTNQQARKEEKQQPRKPVNKKEIVPAKSRAVKDSLPDRTDTPNERTDEPNDDTERLSVLTELEEGVRETKRPTERYSFEIYTDMKEKIEDIQYQYKKKTGKKLSASRMIREALEVYFQKIEEAI